MKKVLKSKIVIALSGILFVAITFSIIQLVRATTPNPGHPLAEIDFPQSTLTTSSTLSANNFYYADATAAALTLTLPSATANADSLILVKKIDSALTNIVTVTSTTGTIDGLTSISLANRGESALFQSDGTNWRLLLRRDYGPQAFVAKSSTLNQWYSSPNTGTALTTGAPTANNLRAIPFIVAKLETIDQMAINVTTLLGTSGRLGIYADNGNEYPGALVVDCGTVSTASTGVKTCTTGLPATLDPGLYWLVYTSDNAPTIRSFAVASLLPVLGYASTLPTNAQFGWTVAFTCCGALPNPYTAGGTVITAVPIPAVFVRVSQ